MSCTLQTGTMAVQVCLNGAQVTYRFGSIGRLPELELVAPKQSVAYHPWSGFGRNIVETVTFENNAYTYEVATALQRGPDAGEDDIPPAFGGTIIAKDEIEIKQISCDIGSVNWSYGGGLFDAKTALGLCWKSGPNPAWLPCSKE